MTAPRVATNLVGRKVHLLTDEEARQEAKDQGTPIELLSSISAVSWLPGLLRHPWPAYRGRVGEVVAIYQEGRDCHLLVAWPAASAPGGAKVEKTPFEFVRFDPQGG